MLTKRYLILIPLLLFCYLLFSNKEYLYLLNIKVSTASTAVQNSFSTADTNNDTNTGNIYLIFLDLHINLFTLHV